MAESGTEWYENGTKWCKNGMGWDDPSAHIDDSEGCKVGVFEGVFEWINVLWTIRCLPISGKAAEKKGNKVRFVPIVWDDGRLPP